MGSNGLFPPTKRDRRARITKLERLLNEKRDKEEYKTIIARFVLEEGVSLRTTKEYLTCLKLAGKIDGEINFELDR